MIHVGTPSELEATSVAAGRAQRYLRWRARVDGGLALVHGVVDGVSLGMLDGAEVDAVGRAYHATGSECLRRSHNRGGLFRWEEAALAERFTAVSRLVVLAAGAGREVIALARRGVVADGYEPDPTLRRLGNDLLVELGLDATIAEMEPSVVPPFNGDYDGAIVGWGAYSLITPRATRVAFVAELVRRLPAHAPVLVSGMTRPVNERYLATVHATAASVRRVRRRERPELGDTVQPNLTHLFTVDELREELAAAGLHVLDAGSGDYGWAVGAVPDAELDLTQVRPTATRAGGSR